VGFGYVPFQTLVESYGRRAQRVAEAVDDPAATSFVMFLRGLSALNHGCHAEARGFIHHALRFAEENRDSRTAHEMRTVLGHAICMGGDRQRALALFDDLAEQTKRTHNPQGVLWSAAARGSVLSFMGRGSEAAAVFDEHMPLLAELADRTQHIVFGLRAFAYMMDGRWEAAREVADATLDLALRERDAGYHVYFGYQGVCEVYLASWERSRSQHLATRARQACEVFERYARIFRLGRPNALYYRGLFEWLAGRQRRAHRAWRRSLELARELAMPYEEGRASYELARHLPSHDARREPLLARAAERFELTSSAYWLDRLQQS
jgi:tetratricopeptide (TPR) repeat protein